MSSKTKPRERVTYWSKAGAHRLRIPGRDNYTEFDKKLGKMVQVTPPNAEVAFTPFYATPGTGRRPEAPDTMTHLSPEDQPDALYKGELVTEDPEVIKHLDDLSNPRSPRFNFRLLMLKREPIEG
ncbi:MAG: hypothetical protein ACH37Z_12215 [Anaerolineae bacterium]